MSWAIIMIYINITICVPISWLEKDHSMIELSHLKDVAIFIQKNFKFCAVKKNHKKLLSLTKLDYCNDWIIVNNINPYKPSSPTIFLTCFSPMSHFYTPWKH